MQKGEEHEAAVYKKHYQYLKDQYANQSRVYKGLAMLSPYLPTRFLSMAIAQTDYGTHWDFSDAAENYRVATQEFLNNDLTQNAVYGQGGYTAKQDFWKKLPQFEYSPPELKTIVKQNTSNFIIIIGWLVVSFSVLFISSKRI